MKLYCPVCGAGTSYSLDKPKFCASCGESYTMAADTTPRRIISRTQRPPASAIQHQHEEVEEAEERFEVPDIDKLYYDLQASRQFSVVSLDKLAGTSEATQGDGYVREADPTYSTESFAEDFRRDAGSSRKNDAETQET